MPSTIDVLAGLEVLIRSVEAAKHNATHIDIEQKVWSMNMIDHYSTLTAARVLLKQNLNLERENLDLQERERARFWTDASFWAILFVSACWYTAYCVRRGCDPIKHFLETSLMLALTIAEGGPGPGINAPAGTRRGFEFSQSSSTDEIINSSPEIMTRIVPARCDSLLNYHIQV